MANIKLNKRQSEIIAFSKKNDSFQTSDILLFLKNYFQVERLTIVRDLSYLEKEGVLIKQGQGRSVFYKLSKGYLLVEEIDIEKYFSKTAKERRAKEKFNFDIFNDFKNIFSDEENNKLEELNKFYQKKIKLLSPGLLKKEIERMNIDFSWMSSKIEGNTYTLLETEHLIKNSQTSAGHTQEEAVMILNHKKTLDYIRENKNEFKIFKKKNIEDIHKLLTQNMGIVSGVRKRLVRISGTNYIPLDNEFQIKEALEDACSLLNEIKNPFEKTIVFLLLIAYIQAFEDGNKRTSRLCGNAILLANDCCPLSYSSINDLEYKKAVLLFYEQNNIFYFKKLFIEQFEFAVENYFG